MSYLLIFLLIPLGLACLSQLLKRVDPLTRADKWYGSAKRRKAKARKRERELTYIR